MYSKMNQYAFARFLIGVIIIIIITIIGPSSFASGSASMMAAQLSEATQALESSPQSSIKPESFKVPTLCEYLQDDVFEVDQVSKIEVEVRKLMHKNEDLNVHCKDNETPLQLAYRHGLRSFVLEMIQFYADVDMIGKDGLSLLHQVVQNLDINMAINLIQTYRADVNIRDGNDNTPLHFLCAERPSSRLSKSGFLSQRDKKRQIALYLLENRATVNAINNGGWTPLDLLCSHSDIDFELHQLLLMYGAQRGSSSAVPVLSAEIILNDYLKALREIKARTLFNVKIPTRVGELDSMEFKEARLMYLFDTQYRYSNGSQSSYFDIRE